MFNFNTSEQPSIIFGRNSFWLKISLLAIFLLATLVRLDEIRAPGHLLDREYTSAIFARAYYFTNNEDVPEWEQNIAVTAKNQQPILEPPLLELLISLIYRIIGREELYFARYLTNFFWLAGGFFMFLLTRKLSSVDEALVATAYYLFVPMGVIISRSIQPDSMMMMFYLISFYLLVIYFEEPSTRRLLSASILIGITLLLRPLVIFAIFCSFLALSYHQKQNIKKVIDPPLMILSAISLLPSIIYYGYGILFAGFMRWKISTSFMPYLLVKKDFWLGWFNNVVNVTEFTTLFLAILGFFLIKNKKTQYLVIALSIGYMMFSVAFTYHIHTHPYYHIQLFPIVGFCLAPAVVSLVQSLKQSTGNRNIWWIPVTGAFLFVVFTGYSALRSSLYQTRMEDPALAQQIGDIIHHSPRTVYVAYYYGLPLEYYGEFAGAPWPVRIEDEFYRNPDESELSVKERMAGLGFIPEYFVITNFDLYNRKHQDLQTYLEINCSPVAQTNKYLIYANCKGLASISGMYH